MICVFIIYDGSTRRLTESGFMEKPGIEPSTPGLQDIGFSPTPRRHFVKTLKCIKSRSGLITVIFSNCNRIMVID